MVWVIYGAIATFSKLHRCNKYVFGKLRLEPLSSLLPPLLHSPAFLLISHLRDHRVVADIWLIDNSSQHSLVPRSPAAQMNPTLSDQRSRTAL